MLASAIATPARQPGPLSVRLDPAPEHEPTRAARRLHVTVEARHRFRVAPGSFGLAGRVISIDVAEAARIAGELRAHGARGATGASLVAAVVLHELMHALLARVDWREAADAAVTERLGADGTGAALSTFDRVFSAPEPPPGRALAATGTAERRYESLEELGLLGLAADNPAMAPFAALFDAGTDGTRLGAASEAMLSAFDRVPVPSISGEVAVAKGAADRADEVGSGGLPAAMGQGVSTLLELLTLPARLHPRSLKGQLEAALSAWRPMLGAGLDDLVLRVLRAIDLLSEEEVRAHPGGQAGPPPPWQSQPTEGLGDVRYSHGSPWMAGAAMVAKSLPVWLEQLSRWHGREVRRLDQVPDEALADLAADGFDTLWLVGVWERSQASRRIKRLQGQPDALASAYAVHDHVVAADLGGEEALADLGRRAAAHGLRLGADMVANHTGIDSRWVEDRPDWFVQSSSRPFPNYTYGGEDLSPGRPFAVRIEDGYYGGNDAAVAFELTDRASGRARYVYHGNDGTGLPWNDTAQIDFLNEEARRAVIATAVEVAQRFPVLRFDAAMTLVRRHVRRLWHPAPGEGGAIPSRSHMAVSEAEFDAAMPREFWRELVEAIREHAPDTMLVAEAFWLMEETFVRHLGFDRVYHSAFMQLLAERRDAELKALLADVADRDPLVLERYVNYLTTPDEESARATFGDGDRYFGVATLLCTLPGLPLFGHGQAEGLSETYGMEFASPRLGEAPDVGFRERHRRQLAPLLRRRSRFASARDLRFLEVVAGSQGMSGVHAYGYAASGAGRPALVLFNHTGEHVRGALLAAGGPPWEALGLPLPSATEALVADTGGAEGNAVWRQADLVGGWGVDLAPYQAVVYLDLRLEPVKVEEAAELPTRRRRLPWVDGSQPVAAARRRSMSRRR